MLFFFAVSNFSFSSRGSSISLVTSKCTPFRVILTSLFLMPIIQPMSKSYWLSSEGQSVYSPVVTTFSSAAALRSGGLRSCHMTSLLQPSCDFLQHQVSHWPMRTLTFCLGPLLCPLTHPIPADLLLNKSSLPLLGSFLLSSRCVTVCDELVFTAREWPGLSAPKDSLRCQTECLRPTNLKCMLTFSSAIISFFL